MKFIIISVKNKESVTISNTFQKVMIFSMKQSLHSIKVALY